MVILKENCFIQRDYNLVKPINEFSLIEFAQLHSEIELIIYGENHPLIKIYNEEKMKKLNKKIVNEIKFRFPKITTVYYSLISIEENDFLIDILFDCIFHYFRLESENFNINESINDSEIRNLIKSLYIVDYSEKYNITLEKAVEFMKGFNDLKYPVRGEFIESVVSNLR